MHAGGRGLVGDWMKLGGGTCLAAGWPRCAGGIWHVNDELFVGLAAELQILRSCSLPLPSSPYRPLTIEPDRCWRPCGAGLLGLNQLGLRGLPGA